VRVEHHLLGLARIGAHEGHPTVAEPDMRAARRGALPAAGEALWASPDPSPKTRHQIVLNDSWMGAWHGLWPRWTTRSTRPAAGRPGIRPALNDTLGPHKQEQGGARFRERRVRLGAPLNVRAFMRSFVPAACLVTPRRRATL
jgi:hypothetical protein